MDNIANAVGTWLEIQLTAHPTLIWIGLLSMLGVLAVLERLIRRFPPRAKASAPPDAIRQRDLQQMQVSMWLTAGGIGLFLAGWNMPKLSAVLPSWWYVSAGLFIFGSIGGAAALTSIQKHRNSRPR